MITGAQIRTAPKSVGEEPSARAVVLACGPIGPVRYRLLSGTEVEVVGAETVQQAVEKAQRSSPKAIITGFELIGGTAVSLLQSLAQSVSNRPPVIVVLKGDQRGEREACYAAGAVEVIDTDDIDRILTSLSRNAVVGSGQFLRSKLDCPVTISYGSDHLRLRCADIRPTGIAVRGFEKPEIGVTVHVTLTLLDRPVQMWAQVARAWTQDGVPMAGLRFLGVMPEQRLWLVNAIEQLSKGVKPEPAPAAPVAAPAATRTTAPEAAVEPASDDARQLASALRMPSLANDLPEWMRPLLGELTTAERQAALGARSAEWARVALAVRLELARFRAKNRAGAPKPAKLTEQCQRLFDLLNVASATEGLTVDLRADVDTLKDKIIHEFLEDGGEAGAKTPTPATPTPAPRKEKERPSAPSEAKLTAARVSETEPKKPLALYPFVLAALGAVLVAAGLRVHEANMRGGAESLMSGSELWMPAIKEAHASSDFASAVVAPSWYTKSPGEQHQAVELLREKLVKRGMPVRFVLLMRATGEPVGFFHADRGELIDVTASRPITVTRVVEIP